MATAELAQELREAGTPGTDADRIAALSRHTDVRVRVLCAKHPQVPAADVKRLARDSNPAVRRVVARRTDLSATLVDELVLDSDRRVRLLVLQNYTVAVDALIRSAEKYPDATEALTVLRERIAVPVVAEELFRRTRWRVFAAQGSFRHAAVRKVIRDNEPFAILLLASHARLTPRSVRSLAGVPFRQVQEAAATRADLSARARAGLLLLGGPWTAAAVLRSEPRGRWRVLAACRRHRVVRRARADTAANAFELRLLGLSLHWDIRQAVAANPRAAAGTLRRQARSRTWAVAETVAQRTDLPARAFGWLDSHPAVQLRIADNPSAPAGVIAEMACRDPFVTALASIHPSLPFAQRLAVASRGDCPRWLLGRLANDPMLPEDERDRLLTWAALGGGSGDASFDPVTCIGTPGPTDETHEQAYRRHFRADGIRSSLWRSRAMVGVGGGVLQIPAIGVLATDANPWVRRVAAGYRSVKWLRRLRFDPSPLVADQAEMTLRSSSKEQLVGRWRGTSRARRLAVIGVCVLVQFIIIARAQHSSSTDHRELAAVAATLLPDDDQPVAIVGHWTAAEPQAGATSLCSAGGTQVWIESTSTGLWVTVASSEKPLAVLGTVRHADTVVELAIPARTIQPGESATFVQLGDPSTRLSLSIGDEPARTLVATVGTQGADAAFDLGGDC